jgi:hypothetical protein
VRAILELPVLDARLPWPASGRSRAGLDRLRSWLEGRPEVWGALLGAVLVKALDETSSDLPQRIDAEGALERALVSLGIEPADRRRLVSLVALARREKWLEVAVPPGRREFLRLVEHWLSDPQIRYLVGFHRARHVDWIRQQDLEELLQWRFALAAVAWTGGPQVADREESAIALVGWSEAVERIRALAVRAEFRADRLLTLGGGRPRQSKA